MLRLKKLVAFFYLFNLAAAALATAPIALFIGTSLAHTRESDRLFPNLDPAWISETVYHFKDAPVTLEGVTIGGIAAAFLIATTFLSGGAVALFLDERAPFFSASARYFLRLFRLMLLSLVCYGVVLALNGALGHTIDHFKENSMRAGPWIVLHWAQLAVTFGLLGVVNMTFDYAKIACVVDQRRSAWRSTFRAVRFVIANPKRTLNVYWSAAAIAALCLLAYHGLSEAIGQQSVFAVSMVFLLRQVYTIARVWTRLWTWSSELKVYDFSSTIVAPEPPSLAVAG